MTVARPALPLVRVVESHDPARLAVLKDAWGELFQAAGSPNPFLSWEWQATFWRTFGQRRLVWILEARDRGERLCGLLVLQGRRSLGGSVRWRLLTNGVTGTDALEVLARPGFGPAARAAIARAVAAALPGWEALDLEDLAFGSPLVAQLAAALAPRGVRVRVEPRHVCPGFALRGTFADHLARFRRRDTYRRRLRWLERQPGYEVRVTTAAADASEAMEDFLRLHRLRWDAEGGSEGIPRGPVEEFHRDVAPLLAARGWLRLYRVFVGGASIAAVYGLEVGGRFYYYQSGMDPGWSARSPGLVLVARTVEDAYARGLTDYDFLRGTEPHKLDWASDRRETCALRARVPGLRSGAEAAAHEAFRLARDAAKAVAPERMWLALRRARVRASIDALRPRARGESRRAAADAPREGGGEAEHAR